MMVQISLTREMFGAIEAPIAKTEAIDVTGFRYSSGVEALRVRTERAELIVLPFKGQQIWRAIFDGRDVTMKSMFDEPRDTEVYLQTYGAFLIHCGISAMGVPAADDNHPLHGEMPNARMQTSHIEIDEAQQSIDIVSSYQHSVSFTTNYRATPRIRLKAGETKIDVRLTVDNLRPMPIELMYLAHANFKPVDHGELIYAASYNAQSVRVRRSIPSHISPEQDYVDFIETLAGDPTQHHKLAPEIAFNPEVVFQIDALSDQDGLFHAMQRHPDGQADFIAYRPDTAPVTMRWICRMGDQEGLGIAFPATAGVEGYNIEKSKGLVHQIEGGGSWVIDMTMGTLDANEAGAMAAHIDTTAGR